MAVPPPPRTSVVVPAYRAGATLPTVLAALRPQVRKGEHEVLVVDSTGDSASQLQECFPWTRVIGLPERVPPGRARNMGAQAAAGDRLIFLDADAVPDRNWLAELEAALTPAHDAVAGAILNGTPRSALGTAGYLLEFSDWLPGRRTPIRHAATCSLLVRRTAFLGLGGFREDCWPGEDTILTFGIGEAGRLGFAPASRVHHLNRTGLREFLRHQRRLGESFAVVCAHVDFPHRALGRPALAPLAAPFRLAALAWRLAPHPREAALAVALLPVIALGLIAWASGLRRARI